MQVAFPLVPAVFALRTFTADPVTEAGIVLGRKVNLIEADGFLSVLVFLVWAASRHERRRSYPC